MASSGKFLASRTKLAEVVATCRANDTKPTAAELIESGSGMVYESPVNGKAKQTFVGNRKREVLAL